MASENGRLPEKQPDGANEHGNAPQVKGDPTATLANPDPASHGDSSADNKYNKWRSGFSNIFYETNMTDWLIVLFTGVLAFYTAQLAGVASRQTEILDNTDKAVHEANQMNAGINRPWVAIKELSLTLPLVYDSVNKTINIKMNFELENTGSSPARFVSIYPYVTNGPSNIPSNGRNRIEIFREECNRHRSTDSPNGMAIFPKENEKQTITTSMSSEEIERAPSASNNPRIKLISPWVYGCVDYRSMLDDKHHQTRFLIWIGIDKGAMLFDLDKPEDIRNVDQSRIHMNKMLTDWTAD